MTNPPLDAGPKLDGTVGRGIMGLKLVKGIWTYWKAPGRWERFNYDAHQHYQNVAEKDLPLVYEVQPDLLSPHPPRYSTELSWAFQVVEALRKE